jgi:hypothetical protein
MRSASAVIAGAKEVYPFVVSHVHKVTPGVKQRAGQ